MQKSVHFHRSYSSLFLPLFRKESSTLRRVLLLAGVMLMLSGINTPIEASDFFKNFVVINYADGTANQYYSTKAPDGTPNTKFDGLNLGTFNRTNTNRALLLNGAEANTYNQNGDVTSTRMWYRIYPENSRSGSFTAIELGFRNSSGVNKLWDQTSQGLNLVSLTPTNGRYVLEVYFEGNENNGGPTIYDSQGFDVNYRARFTVEGALPTTWTGTVNEDWNNSGNWTNGVPTRDNDALIPVGPTNFPNITAGAFQVHNLVIAGTAPNNRAVLRLTDGRLEVYGNFSNALGGFEQAGGVFELAANEAQSFDGDNFFNFEVSGSGNKQLIGQMTIQGQLRFQGGILVTDPRLPTSNNVTLLGNATIQNEREGSYLSGTITARQVVNQNAVATFGNIGLRYENTNVGAGETLVTRITGISYPSASNQGQSVQRSFNIVPENDVTAQVTLSYLDVERGNLNENNLVVYRSINGGATFDQLGKDGNSPQFNFVTKAGVPGNGLFVLSQQRAPLPVALTSFTSARQGEDAILTWATAQEENNAGFDVQVSTDGTSFRTLTTITPKSPNSTIGYTYRYIDQELGKSGLRYYRLRQFDIDGKESFYGPRTVDFGDAAVAFSAAPNPFISEVTLTTQTSVAGGALLRLTDMNGRTVREQTLKVAKGVSNLAVPNLDALAGGMYFVQLTLPDGQVQRTKVLKQ